MFALMKMEWRKIKIPAMLTVLLLTIVTCALSGTLYRNYVLFYDLEAWEIGTEFLTFLFPLLTVVPLCWNLYYERKNNFLLYVAPRIPIRRYLTVKWSVHAAASFFILFIPCLLSAVFALYVKGPINSVIMSEGMTGFQHAFQQTFIKTPLLYAIALSAWKSLLGVLAMTFGFVLSLSVKNIFVILTGPFVYAVLENFILAILRLEAYRLVVAFDPSCLSSSAYNALSPIAGPAILLLVIIGCRIYFSKIRKVSAIEV